MNTRAIAEQVTFRAIVEGVQMLREVVTEWENAPADKVPIVNWRGGQRKAVSEEVQQAADALFELVHEAEIEDSVYARALVLAIDEFDDAFCKWAENCSKHPDRTDPAGGPEVWSAYQRMLHACTRRVYSKPEPIPALVKQGTNYRQIAKIYGWYDDNRNPDTDKVQQELTAPGTHYNAKTWVHPSERRWRAEIDAKWALRSERVRSLSNVNQAVSSKRREVPQRQAAPESLDDLILQGINVRQIAKMKRVTEDEVRDRAAEMGVPLDGNVISAAYAQNRRRSSTMSDEEAAVAAQAEQLRLAGFKNYGELGNDLNARVLALHGDGAQPRDIVKVLEDAFPGLQYQKVTRIISEANKKAG